MERLAVTVEEAAEALTCPKKTVYRLIKEGHLPAIRLTEGTHGIRIKVSVLEAFAEQGGVTS